MQQKHKVAVALLSVVSNSALIAMKLAIGVAIGSVSVLSEAIHSGVNLIAAVIALMAVRESARPADRDHPFGHGKIENVSGSIEAILIFLAAAWIIFEAVRRLLQADTGLDHVGWGVAVMLISSVVNAGVSRLLFKVGRATESPALQADAWHLLTDVWTSAGVMAALALIWVGEKVFPGHHFHWVDPVAAICVAMLIIHAAYRLTLESSRDLLDVNLPPKEEADIRSCAQAHGAAVHGVRSLRTRKSGPTRFVEMELLMDPTLSVEDSHRIADEIGDEIKRRFPGSDVMIHVEPFKPAPAVGEEVDS